KYPHAIRHLFDRISKSLDEGNEIDLLDQLKSGTESLSGQVSSAELIALKSNLSLIPEDARLRPQLRPTFELIRSLSFVAEIGYNPQEDGPLGAHRSSKHVRRSQDGSKR